MATFSRIMILSLLFLGISAMSFFQVSQATVNYRPMGDIPPGINTCPVPLSKCGSECDRRCSATSHKNNCLLFCNKCCDTCLCVPPGTYGNKECCSCYYNWKTREGGPKCP
ncbi:hypothetical protein M9H77_01193 [Catharanthus roseus]|uniref:Uncharacterized protein n=1 Tax=Catharanthus roseus TaxID=4058 RepID=A0ACC0C4V7_CATRO|nr:hypothetical protein M9H77_01193 [Catharanthus roseus]